MSQGLRIGLILHGVPGYSETFIWSKIKGLMSQGNSLSLFVSHYKKSSSIKIPISIYKQPDLSKRYLLPFILFYLVCTHPIRVIKFINLERLSEINWFTIITHLLINSHILKQNLEWIHFEFATVGIYRENVARAMGIKSAVSFRGYDIGLYPYKHKGCYNLLWQRIDKVHTISDDLYKHALEIGLNSDVIVEKITPAIDTKLFFSTENPGLHEPLRILSVGRLNWKKGFEYSLQALKELKEEKIDFEYRIVGKGHYKETIIYSIHQLGLNNNVKLSGELSPEKVKKEMEWADIYIQPSIQEGFCNAVLEAQALGLLCIVTDAEGLSENVINKQTGWVVDKRNPHLIKEQIINILKTDKIELQKISRNAINRVRNKFNLEVQTEKFCKFYSQ